jgi:hypothetical protein
VGVWYSGDLPDYCLGYLESFHKQRQGISDAGMNQCRRHAEDASYINQGICCVWDCPVTDKANELGWYFQAV